MGFHLAPQTATGRTSPIDQMCDHQLSRLLGRPHSPEFSGWGVQAHTDSLPT